jgi:hypothetical protein
MLALTVVAVLFAADGGDRPRLVCDGVSQTEAGDVVNFHLENPSATALKFCWFWCGPKFGISTKATTGWSVVRPLLGCGNGWGEAREIELPPSATARWKTDASSLRRFGEHLQLTLAVARVDTDGKLVKYQIAKCMVDLTGVPESEPATRKVELSTTATASIEGRSTCNCRRWRR